ncbi:hypothetical protein BH09PSE2_BH09PSE2_23320 [soil metagenome]
MMADGRSVAEIADRRARHRSRMIWVIAVFFLLWQTSFYQWGLSDAPPVRLVDQVRQSAWVAWAAGLLVLLGTGGGFSANRAVRRLMNDEVSTANRVAGQRWGFWAAMLTVFTLYAASFFAEISLHDALHLVLTFAIGCGLLRWAVLERRADRLA